MKSIRFDVLRVTVGVFFVSLLLFAGGRQACCCSQAGDRA
jgi:hypothetical protein